MSYTITVTCEKGHSEQMHISEAPQFGLPFAEELAGLMDGTSPAYIYSPIGDPNSMIGKCNICRSQIKCEVTRPDPDVAPDPGTQTPTVPPVEGSPRD